MGDLDLDAARAARAESRSEPHHILVDGEKFELPPELPWDYFEILETGEMKDALQYLLEDGFDAFWAHRLSADDVKDLAVGIPRLYGFGGPGESSASGGQSVPTGNPSRQTSAASTRQTSGKRSGASRRTG